MRLICSTSTDDLEDPESSWKSTLNYIVTANCVLLYLRAFSYLLLIESLSKMILTFFNMILDTLPFLFLFLAFLVMTVSIFSTLFGNSNSDNFGSFFSALGSVVDSVL